MGHIVLIGPIGVGKSTVASLVAAQLGRPAVELDDIRSEFFETLGYDERKANLIAERDGVIALTNYWKPFEILLVEHVVAQYSDSVVDFGAGHSHFEDDAHLRRASAALSAHRVVLLMPSIDPSESERILDARQPDEYRDVIRELNATFLRSRSNGVLADRVLYTGTRPPEEIAAEVVAGSV
jgi:shikimate kinase